MAFVCHVASQDHVIKVYCDFLSRTLSLQFIALPRLIAIGTEVTEI